jgi:hypothetical protein
MIVFNSVTSELATILLHSEGEGKHHNVKYSIQTCCFVLYMQWLLLIVVDFFIQ